MNNNQLYPDRALIDVILRLRYFYNFEWDTIADSIEAVRQRDYNETLALQTRLLRIVILLQEMEITILEEQYDQSRRA